MRRTLLAAALLAPATALAILGTSFKVGVRDAATGQPLDGAFIVAREFATVGKLHGRDTYCVRGDVAPTTAPWVTMDLPDAGTDANTRAKALEAFAYRPGYCLAKTADAARESSRIHDPMGTPAPGNVLDSRNETRLELRRATQAPDERLLYLEQASAGLLCARSRWSPRARESMRLLADAMAGEAQAIARDRYENLLAQRLRAGLASASALPSLDSASAMRGLPTPGFAGSGYARDFIVGPADLRVSWDGQHGIAIAARTGALQAARPLAAPMGATAGNAAIAASPSGPGAAMAGVAGIDAQPLRLVVHCRHGAPSGCNLNERDAEGLTAINAYIQSYKQAEVRVLLEAGADPSIPAKPFGPQPIDIALRYLLRMDRTHSGREHVAQIVDLLAADPRTTITQALKDDLAADPSTWNLASRAAGLELLLARREALAGLPVRAEAKPGCEAPGFTHRYDEGPVRLRLPRGYP